MAGLYPQARDDSPEAKVFRRHYAVLVNAIQDPESLADGLFSRNVIGIGLLQELQLDSLTKAKKNRKLLLAVQDQLMVNPCKFTELMEALQGYSSLELTVEKLQRDYFVATQKPNLEQLEVELRHVHAWVHLGLCLDLPKHSLDEIHASHSSGVDALGKCKIKMLAMWLNRSKNPTWSAFIAALLDARLWSTASKIATKYGIELPSKVLPKGKAPPQIKDVVQDAQKLEIITSMRENIELKHVQLNEINEGIEQNEKEIQMLKDDLTSIKKSLQSNERYTGLLMSDLQVQQLQSACKEEEKQHIEIQMSQLELEGSPIPEEVRKQFHQAQESVASCRLNTGQLESQIISLRKASSELTMQLQQMNLHIDDIAKELDGLQIQKKELLRDVHMKEQELDSCLLGKSATTPFLPANAEIAYYNIMMCAGRVEVKLRQSEIDQYERKLLEKEAEAANVREILKQQQKKLQELKDQSQKGAKIATQPHSSDYQYAYMHMQSKNEMEAHELEQRISKLQAENLQYRIQLAVVGSQKCALETEMQALIQEVVSLKTAQATLEQTIAKARPSFQDIQEVPTTRVMSPKSPGPPPVARRDVRGGSFESSSRASVVRRDLKPGTPRTSHSVSTPVPPHPSVTMEKQDPGLLCTPLRPPRTDLALADQGWYWGNISREEVLSKLWGTSDGTFLVRDSIHRVGEYTLTVRKAGTNKLIRIINRGGMYGFSLPTKFTSVPELIDFYTHTPLTNYNPRLDITLSNPLSRFVKVDSDDEESTVEERDADVEDLLDKLKKDEPSDLYEELSLSQPSQLYQPALPLPPRGPQLGSANSEQKSRLRSSVGLSATLSLPATFSPHSSNLEQKIDKCTLPVLRKPKTQPPLPPSVAQPRPQPPPPLPPRHIPFSSESQLLDPQCKLKWRRGADLPVAMDRPHLVKIRNNIYCGGGYNETVDTARLVFKYDPAEDNWSSLPPCPTHSHGLSEHNDALVSVGGVMHYAQRLRPTNKVYKFQDPHWVTSLPPMHTARFDPSVITHNTNLIACGGVTSWTSVEQHTCTTTVEVLNNETGQWSALAPLPFALRHMSTAISNGRCYLIGGSRQKGHDHTAYSAQLPLLLASASNPSPSSAVWEVLPNCPLYGSTAAELGGCVLALGGQKPGARDGSTDVYLYSQNSTTWRRATAMNLPNASYFATSATLAGNSVVVVGGWENPWNLLNTVFFVNLDN